MSLNPAELLALIESINEPPKTLLITTRLSHPICEVDLFFDFRCEPEQYTAALLGLGFTVSPDALKAVIEFGSANDDIPKIRLLSTCLKDAFIGEGIIVSEVIQDSLLETRESQLL